MHRALIVCPSYSAFQFASFVGYPVCVAEIAAEFCLGHFPLQHDEGLHCVYMGLNVDYWYIRLDSHSLCMYGRPSRYCAYTDL